MKVLISEHKHADVIRSGRIAFNDMLTQSDIISLHCPLNQDTDQLITHDSFKRMKPTAVLVNTARGQIIDTEALKTALINKEIGYAIIDVLVQEPPRSNELLLQNDISNISVTAHIAWASQQAQQRLISIIADNIKAYQLNQVLNRVI